MNKIEEAMREQLATDRAKREQAIAHERRLWWQLRECYARCVQIVRDEWDAELARATAEQYALAVTMRDRIREGTRATGAKYEVDYGIPVPLLTPRDRVQFVKEAAVTLFIEACKKSLPVTVEGTKREAQSGQEVTFVVPAEGPQPHGVTEVTTSADTTAGLRRYIGRILETKREAQEGDEAGSGVDETLDDADAERLAQAGETVVSESAIEGTTTGGFAFPEAPAS